MDRFCVVQFSYASTKVKPELLSIFETFYLPLGERLQPAVSGLILALLPGLEDEANELYGRVLALLHAIREATNNPVFMLSIWRCLLFCPQCRLAAVNYLAVTIPKGPLQMKRYADSLLPGACASFIG